MKDLRHKKGSETNQAWHLGLCFTENIPTALHLWKETVFNLQNHSPQVGGECCVVQ